MPVRWFNLFHTILDTPIPTFAKNGSFLKMRRLFITIVIALLCSHFVVAAPLNTMKKVVMTGSNAAVKKAMRGFTRPGTRTKARQRSGLFLKHCY